MAGNAMALRGLCHECHRRGEIAALHWSPAQIDIAGRTGKEQAYLAVHDCWSDRGGFAVPSRVRLRAMATHDSALTGSLAA